MHSGGLETVCASLGAQRVSLHQDTVSDTFNEQTALGASQSAVTCILPLGCHNPSEPELYISVTYYFGASVSPWSFGLVTSTAW